MQKESYDIEKVKYYFFYYCFKGYAHIFQDTGNEFPFSKESFLSQSIIAPAVGVFLTCLGSLVLIFWIMQAILDGHIYLILIFLPALITIGAIGIALINEFKKSYGFSRFNRYFTLKSPFPSFLERFKKSVNVDIFSDGLDPVDIDEIYRNMKSITKLLSLITGPLIEFRKLGIQLPEEARKVLEKFIRIEVEWISEYVSEFRETLTTWMKIHESELSEYQRNNLLSKNEEVYTLASTRLSSHIENLEKVRVSL